MDERLEFKNPVRLKGNDGVCFIVPASIICDKEIDTKRVTVFSYFSTYKGLNHRIYYSLNHIAGWMNKQPNRNKTGVNGKIAEMIEYLESIGYLSFPKEKPAPSSWCSEAIFNQDKLIEERDQDRFSIIYLDELRRILDYKTDVKYGFQNNDAILLVFAYLRMMIYRRRNKVMDWEIGEGGDVKQGIRAKQEKNPEVYDCYYKDIAGSLGLSPRIVSNAVDVLSRLGLIYHEEVPRKKYSSGGGDRYRTNPVIFCNTYKREGGLLLAAGQDYYLREVENKKKKLSGAYWKESEGSAI